MVSLFEHFPEKRCSAAYFFAEDLSELSLIAEVAHKLVVCRTRFDGDVARLVNAFKRLHKPVLFDVDDLVFDSSLTSLLVDTLGLDADDPAVWDSWFAYTARLGATALECDGGICSTAPLARALSSFAKFPVEVVPNFLNEEQLVLSCRIRQSKQQRAPLRDESMVLGYFSGSPSHAKDFAILEPVLSDLLEEDPRVSLLAVGYVQPSAALARHKTQVKKAPFQDYLNLQRLIGDVDINLMPLQVNEFTDCKSELKYFDAAAVETVSIASPSATYAAVIRHGENGLLSRSLDWDRVLRDAMDRREEMPEMSRQALADTEQQFTWKTQWTALEQGLKLG
jgi:glycosyltransferase involved in cell wall biosynthesis